MGVEVKYRCNSCGEEIDASETICSHCGVDIEEAGRKITINITEVLRLRDQVEITQIQNSLRKQQKIE
jgi:DNA-directed RNA polymerase subunit RPC12/RpoP